MKLRIELDGQEYSLDVQRDGPDRNWRVTGPVNASGRASVEPIGPGVFSVLLGSKSITVRIIEKANELEIWAGDRHYTASVSDARDRAASSKKHSAAGPVELRAQMPGKIVKLLVETGSKVQVGQGVIVVEAMKMQNEMKSPKDGTVTKIRAAEGATVAAGETLVVIE